MLYIVSLHSQEQKKKKRHTSFYTSSLLGVSERLYLIPHPHLANIIDPDLIQEAPFIFHLLDYSLPSSF